MAFPNRFSKSSTTRFFPKLKIKKKNSSPYQGTIDYKNIVLLRKFVTVEGKILSRRVTGLTAKQQRAMSKAIKNARMTSLLPFITKAKNK